MSERRPLRVRSGAWKAYLATGLLLIGLYALLPAGAGANLLYLGLGAAAAVALVVGTLAHAPSRPTAWWCFAGGIGLWVVGDVIATYGSGEGTATQVAYVLGYLLLGAGVTLVIRTHGRRGDVLEVIDGWMAVVGLLLLTYVFVVEPVLRDVGGDADTVVHSGFAVADILLLAGMIRAAWSPGATVRSAELVQLALGATMLADVLTVGGLLYGLDLTGLEVLWLLGYVGWGAAALHPSMTRMVESPERSEVRLGARSLLLAGLAAMVAPVLLVVQALTGRDLDVWAAALGSTLLTGLVLLRLRLTVGRIAEAGRAATELRDQLTYEANHDSLTLLPNRGHGLFLIGEELDRAQLAGTGTVAVMFVDLDGFKSVNDTLGHRAGDLVLRAVAERLKRSVRDQDVAIRLGGDEFVVMLRDLADAATAIQVAGRLVDIVSQPVRLGPLGSTEVGASIGVALCRPGEDQEQIPAVELLERADQAAYRAKADGKGRARLYDDHLAAEVATGDLLEADLRAALGAGELVLHYQPIIDAHSGQVRAHEALVRWQRPAGLLLPGEFLPVAERSELVCDIDRWVLHEATAQSVRWSRELGRDDLVMAVNISSRHVASPRLVDDVREALEVSGLPAGRLALELRERDLRAGTAAVRHLEAVRALGVSVSVADLGSGIGVLAELADLPVDLVKLGGRLLEVGTTTGDRLLHLVVQAAHAVGLQAVAEGVEHSVQLATLRSLDCEMVQGFHIARPMTADDALAHAARQARDPFSGLVR